MVASELQTKISFSSLDSWRTSLQPAELSSFGKNVAAKERDLRWRQRVSDIGSGGARSHKTRLIAALLLLFCTSICMAESELHQANAASFLVQYLDFLRPAKGQDRLCHGPTRLLQVAASETFSVEVLRSG